MIITHPKYGIRSLKSSDTLAPIVFEVFSFFGKMFSINLIIIMMLFRFLSSENENESI